MYSFGLVRRRRRRKVAAIIAAIGAIGTAVFIIVAFIGRQVGTFTVNLKNDGVSLTMDTHSDFENETSYLNASGFGSFSTPYSYKWFVTSTSENFAILNDEDTPTSIGKDSDSRDSLKYFKYTFFIKNNGSLDATFDMSIDLTENLKPTNGAQSLDEYLRLMIFENNEKETIFAKRSLTRPTDQYGMRRELLDMDDDSLGEAEMFYDETTLAKITNNIAIGEIRMYTLLFWLEGADPECARIPNQASLRIGATINAYPQNKQID
jgi:hypothetical protein